jgi:phage recombination protein Bet
MGAITKHTETSASLAVASGYTEQQVDLIKRTIAAGATDDELHLFLHVSKRMQLDPFARQIYAVKRYDSQQQREVMSIQVGIDGFRLTADRTEKYAGQVGPQWCGEDGVWKDVWLAKQSPAAARVGVLRKDFAGPLWAVARFDAYAQRKRDGSLTMMWATKGDIMIAKCAESLALRKAFPAELSGVYSSEEMQQADNEPARAQARPAASPARRPSSPPPALPPHDASTGEIIDAESDPADFVMTSGKNAGKRMGDLDGRSLSWYRDEGRDRVIGEKARAILEQRKREREIEQQAAEAAQAKAEQGDAWDLAGEGGDEAEAEAMASAHDQ